MAKENLRGVVACASGLRCGRALVILAVVHRIMSESSLIQGIEAFSNLGARRVGKHVPAGSGTPSPSLLSSPLLPTDCVNSPGIFAFLVRNGKSVGQRWAENMAVWKAFHTYYFL